MQEKQNPKWTSRTKQKQRSHTTREGEGAEIKVSESKDKQISPKNIYIYNNTKEATRTGWMLKSMTAF